MAEKKYSNAQIISELRRNIRFNICYHADANCSKDFVKAHSISNARILDKISKNGELITVSVDMNNRALNAIAVLSGKKKSSTFTGMCGFHDKLYHPIDNEDYAVGNKEQEFLFAYRIAAREYFTKKTQMNASRQSANIARGIQDPPSGFDISAILNNPAFIAQNELMADATEEALSVMDENRSYLNKLLDRGAFHRIKTVTFEFSDSHDIAVASGYLPQVDLNGNVLNDLLQEKMTTARPLYLTVFPQNGKTYILVSYLAKNRKKMEPFIKSIQAMSVPEQKILFSNLIADNCENVFFHPGYWQKLGPDAQKQFLKQFGANIDIWGFDPLDKSIVRDSTLNLFV